MTKIVYPAYFQVIKREADGWHFRHGKVFYSISSQPIDVHNREQAYGLSDVDITIALFRINGGKAGYYLANLRDRQYYYCGEAWEDVRAKLQELGIGRADPQEA